MPASSSTRNIVLLGLGHTHAHVVKHWAKEPIADCNLIAITDFLTATYSGMLPGVLAGDYSDSQMQIDLVRLCKAANVRLIQDQVAEIDRRQQRIYFQSGRQLPYSLLSVAVGSQPPRVSGVKASDDWFVSIKPMQTLLPRISQAIKSAIAHCKSEGRLQLQIDIVGGGLGSLEIAMCLPGFMKQAGLKPSDYQMRVISGSDNPPEGCLRSTRSKIQAVLKQRNVTLLTGAYLDQVEDRQLILRNGVVLSSDLAIYVGAGDASPVTEVLGVPLDNRRCILTDDSLRSTGDVNIWAAGDCGSIVGKKVPKAGVYAVRQGPVIWNNLKRWAAGQTLESYRPQHDFLKLINTGDRSALGQWKWFSFQGRWVWRMKDRIDRKFLEMYQSLAQGKMESESADRTTARSEKVGMRCLGCGGKVGGKTLRETLAQLVADQPADSFQVLDPQSLRDDVAIWKLPEAEAMAVTVDSMADPIGDPFVFGKIATLHSLSDLWASGIRPRQITLSVELPFGAAGQASLLQEVMSGVVQTLAEHQVQLVGGHTLEGPRLSLSITAFGSVSTPVIPLPKQGLKAGDVLIYTKRLGIGVALAAAMRNRCSALTLQSTITEMLLPNNRALELAKKFQLHAATDVTGFGIAGHLYEMLGDALLTVVLDSTALSKHLLPGVSQLIHDGIESTLAPSNRAYLPPDWLNSEQTTAIVSDPQTSGGLLFAIPADQAQDCLDYLAEESSATGWVLGRVENADRSQPWLIVEALEPRSVSPESLALGLSGPNSSGSQTLPNSDWDEDLDLP